MTQLLEKIRLILKVVSSIICIDILIKVFVRHKPDQTFFNPMTIPENMHNSKYV